MGKRPSSAKATRGASHGKRPVSSSSSNPQTTKFRSQYNSLAVIAKGGPSKRVQNKEAMRKLAVDAAERKKLLNGLEGINMIDLSDATEEPKKSKSKKTKGDDISEAGTRMTTASFASVWSNCTNSSLNEFFAVWNPQLETHKDALAVVAGLSQILSSKGTEQTDLEFTKNLIRIVSSSETPINILTGALLALTFVIRKLSPEAVNENFDLFYPVLKDLMEKYHNEKRKTLIKSLIRCFAALSKAHTLGKEAIESSLRKKINLAIRQYKVQDKVRL